MLALGRRINGAIDAQVVTSIDDIHRFLSEWPVGAPANLTIVRGKEKLAVEVTPIEAESLQ